MLFVLFVTEIIPLIWRQCLVDGNSGVEVNRNFAKRDSPTWDVILGRELHSTTECEEIRVLSCCETNEIQGKKKFNVTRSRHKNVVTAKLNELQAEARYSAAHCSGNSLSVTDMTPT